jgi:glycosyltransferase involved in cell wall biosynthesis
VNIATVIPAYNAGRFIREALDSVAAQTRASDDVIVVDDGSTDGTAAVVQDWADRNAYRVRLIRQANTGPGPARNAGIRHATADMIALLDADDVWLPHHLEQAEIAFGLEKDLVLCFANHAKFRDGQVVLVDYLADKAVQRVPFEQKECGFRLLAPDVYSSLLYGNYIPPSTAVFSRQAAERIRLFDPRVRLAEDRDFFLRLSRIGRFGFFPSHSARYRVHDANVSHPRNALAFSYFGLEVVTKMLRMADELNLTLNEREATRVAAAQHARHLLYGASRKGLRTYLRYAGGIVRKGLIRPVLDPTHLLRAIRYFRGVP